MELSGCNGLNYDIGEKALRGLLDTFGSVFTLKEIAFAYRNARRNPDLGGKQLNLFYLSSTSEARDKKSSKSSNSNIFENSFYANGKSRPSKTKWRPVSRGTVSSFLGKNYPLKSYPKEFPMSALCGEGTKQKQSKDDHLQKDVEDFLFKLLGEVFQLNRDVIREVPVICGYDMQKVRTISS
ncbi:hypothetical protein CISIN_1g038866mg [Citrus sinensis]|uniref:Uncharacterized protein n=1 Tax=Citrus sinensis TaxID=2711 RepID=A0A067DG40_CITSI|nr:hypothetical protein CISIN_1g038866mg [Citrus sinensis]